MTWLGLAMALAIVHLPQSGRVLCGAALGRLGHLFARNRRHIVEVNLELCFPEWTSAQRDALVQQIFRSSGISLIETAAVWLRDAEDFRQLVEIEGLEHFNRAIEAGDGVILMGMHLSTLDFCGAVVGTEAPFDVMYRRNKNELLETVMTRGRLKNFPSAIERDDMRSVIRALKRGHAVWYGPDQDYGRRHSVFVPFFAEPAATITVPSRLAKMTGAPILMFTHYRRPGDDCYIARFSAPVDHYPSGDDEADAALINRKIEHAIMVAPDQYWWLHRRFKTRPDGLARPY